jgi:hypothetical protein
MKNVKELVTRIPALPTITHSFLSKFLLSVLFSSEVKVRMRACLQDCMARMQLEAQQLPVADLPNDCEQQTFYLFVLYD